MRIRLTIFDDILEAWRDARREDKGERLFRLFHDRILEAAPGVFLVPSEEDPEGEPYQTDLDNPQGPSCDCRDWTIRGKYGIKCGHIKAAQKVRERGVILIARAS